VKHRSEISKRTADPNVLGTMARRAMHRAVALALLAACGTSRADERDAAASLEARQPLVAALMPRGIFAQFGMAHEVTTGTVGVIWSLGRDSPAHPWSVYAEASASRWQTRSGYASEHGVLTQVSLIPVLRYRMDEGRSPWFVEGGVGVTVTSSVYRSTDKHFSTAFNFGDHLGVGYAFGAARNDEIALRAEHFSNAGIKHPNPGQNFVELRYTHYFR
jgi:hypothetical protein